MYSTMSLYLYYSNALRGCHDCRLYYTYIYPLPGYTLYSCTAVRRVVTLTHVTGERCRTHTPFSVRSAVCRWSRGACEVVVSAKVVFFTPPKNHFSQINKGYGLIYL